VLRCTPFHLNTLIPPFIGNLLPRSLKASSP